MSEKIVVVALGHRALGTTLPEQKVAVKAAAKLPRIWLRRVPALSFPTVMLLRWE